MTFLFLAIFCWFSEAQADDPFFKNLKGKEPALQQQILAKRISFDSQLESPLNTKKNVVEYLKLKSLSDAKKLQFLFQILSTSENKDFSEIVFNTIFETIKAEDLFRNREEYIGNLSSELAKRYDKEFILHLFDRNDLDSYLKNKQAIAEIGKRFVDKADENMAEHLFTLAYRLNLDEVATHYSQKIKGPVEKKWYVRHIYCYFLVNKGQFQQADKCFSKIPNIWGPLGKLYAQKLQGSSIQDIKEQFEKLRGQIKKLKPRLLVYEYFLTEDLSASSLQEVRSTEWDYQNGFLIVMLNRKHQKIPKEFIQEIQSSIVERHPNGFLTKVLQGTLPSTRLKKWFGEKSIFSQSVR